MSSPSARKNRPPAKANQRSTGKPSKKAPSPRLHTAPKEARGLPNKPSWLSVSGMAGWLIGLCLLANSGVRGDVQALKDLQTSLQERYGDKEFAFSTPVYHTKTHCYVIDFYTDTASEPYVAYVRNGSVSEDFAAAHMDVDLSLEFSAQCSLLAQEALEEFGFYVDSLSAIVDVERDKYPATMSYSPTYMDEKVDFRIAVFDWDPEDDVEVFIAWCNEVYSTLQFNGFHVGQVQLYAYYTPLLENAAETPLWPESETDEPAEGSQAEPVLLFERTM